MIELRTVADLRCYLADKADDQLVLCQVVGSESGAWNVFVKALEAEECHFKWTTQPIIFQAYHPTIKRLPMDDDLSAATDSLRKIAAERGLDPDDVLRQHLKWAIYAMEHLPRIDQNHESTAAITEGE